jgi:CRP-like cAMP-binding protein
MSDSLISHAKQRRMRIDSALLRGLDIVRFAPDDVLFTSRSVPNAAYLVIEGTVNLFKNSATGGGVLRTWIKEGGVAGLAAIVPGIRHVYRAEAATKLLCARMDLDLLQKRLSETDPFMRYWIEFMTARLDDIEHPRRKTPTAQLDVSRLVKESKPSADTPAITPRSRDNVLVRRSVPAGQILFRQGDDARFAFTILRGKVDIIAEDGPVQKHLATLVAGQIFGEVALMMDSTRTATAHARTACELLVIEKKKFDRKIAKLNPLMRIWVDALAKGVVSATRGVAQA